MLGRRIFQDIRTYKYSKKLLEILPENTSREDFLLTNSQLGSTLLLIL
jgi:hypothetical protein